MRQFVLVILMVSLLAMYPSKIKAVTLPCSMVLEPVNKELSNARGSALIYNVQLRPPSTARTNISLLGVHLPEPSSFGDYDSYVGFAIKPNEISWRFSLYPTPEINSPTWAGRFDEITAEMENVEVQIRLANSKDFQLGPAVLQSNIKNCE